jgi:hypothetical protein
VSVDAPHDSVTDVVVLLGLARLAGVVGGVVSDELAFVVTEIWLLLGERLPAPSRARTVYVYAVFGVSPVSVNDVPVVCAVGVVEPLR